MLRADEQHPAVSAVIFHTIVAAVACEVSLVRRGQHIAVADGDNGRGGFGRCCRRHTDGDRVGQLPGDGETSPLQHTVKVLVCVQPEIVRGSVRAFFVDIAGEHAAAPVVCNPHIPGDGHGAAGSQKHAAAFCVRTGDIVAGDGAAGHGEGAGGVNLAGVGIIAVVNAAHHAAALGLVRAARLVAGDDAALHGEAAAVADANTAGAACGRLVQRDFAAFHGKAAAEDGDAAIAYSCVAADGSTAGHGERRRGILGEEGHAATVFGSVSRDLSIAGQDKCAALYVYTAAVAVFVGDFAAADCLVAADGGIAGQGAVALGIHAAAEFCSIGGVFRAAADDAARHREYAVCVHKDAAAIVSVVVGDGALFKHECPLAPDIHTAAAAAACGFQHSVAGNGTVMQIECCAFAHIHARAAAIALAVVGRIVRDGAGVHMEGTARAGIFGGSLHIHAAAVDGVAYLGTVAGDGAAVHIEDAAAGDIHAAAVLPAVAGDNALTVAAAVAVGQGKGHALADRDDAVIEVAAVDTAERVAVEVEHNAVLRLPFLCVDLHILRQVVVACAADGRQAGNTLPGLALGQRKAVIAGMPGKQRDAAVFVIRCSGALVNVVFVGAFANGARIDGVAVGGIRTALCRLHGRLARFFCQYCHRQHGKAECERQ